MFSPAHHTGSPAARAKLIRRIVKLLKVGAPTETRVKIELDVLRSDPIEAPFNEHSRRHTLIDDNPCSG